MASGGTGRGGRGAILLQALAKSARRPGESESEAEEKVSQTPSLAAPAPLGRGSILASLRQSLQSHPSQELPAQPPAVTKLQSDAGGGGGDFSRPGVARGRGGLSAMKALIAQQKLQQDGDGVGSQRTIAPDTKHGLTQQSGAIPKGGASQSEPPTEKFSTLDVRGGESKGRKFADTPRGPPIVKRGESGNKVSLTANYIQLLCQKKEVYQYHVDFTPILDNKRLKISLLAEHKSLLKSVQGFDGSILYLPFKLPNKETVLQSTRKTDGSIITITISFTRYVPIEHMSHFFNVVLRRIMNILKMVQVGRYHYNPHSSASVPQHKLEVWPGYVTAVKEHEGGLMLCLDASHRVLRTETVLDIMEQTVFANPADHKDCIYKTVVGQQVLTRYNNKIYRVDDVIWTKDPSATFTLSRGEEMSFVQYYKTHYNINIKNATQPLLLTKEKPPKGLLPGEKFEPKHLCLIPELCYMSGLTDEMRKNFRKMKDLAVHTRVTPNQRQLALKKFIASVRNTAEAAAELDFWGLKMDSSTVSIDGRILQPVKIKMGGAKSFSAGPQGDWSRECTRSQLLSAINLQNWGVFYTRKDAKKANDFITTMQREATNMGVNVRPPFRQELANEKIDTLLQDLRHNINPQVQIVVIINPTSRDDRYAAIKKLCCVEVPVPSQVINAYTISKPEKLRSVVQKIALQINCKLGGELWAVNIPLSKLMVVGMDSYHDATRGRQSIGGCVASLNSTCTRWYSKVCFQKPSQELVHGLQICLTAALKKYHEVNHFLPEKIVIFRDGVGDGQINVVRDHEVQQLQRCFSSFGRDYAPLSAMVVVQKRINTRIFSRDRGGNDFDNPPPGTIVDNTVTRRDLYDYFIVSQHVRQGTVSPTHYIVVDDGLNLSPDHMQKLTYNLTHLYYNWPGTVRVPAPCQYAHKLAYLVGENIHKEPAECLSDRLFFL